MSTMDDFDGAYEAWFKKHLRESRGDRRLHLERRMKEDKGGGDGAERLFLRNMWWPLRGNLDELIPEYEVLDGFGVVRYLDHAFIRYSKLFDFEVEGYGPHQKNASMRTFADDRRRTAGLRLVGWNCFQVAYSDLHNYPVSCQQMLKRWMEAFEFQSQKEEWTLHVVRIGMHNEFTLSDVCCVLRCSGPKARLFVRELLSRGIIVSVGGGRERLCKYKINEEYIRRNHPRKIDFRD